MSSGSLESVAGDISSLIQESDSESESESEDSGRGGKRMRRVVIWGIYEPVRNQPNPFFHCIE